MGFHMLRRRLGDDAFRKWAAASTGSSAAGGPPSRDVREGLEAVSGEDLGALLRRLGRARGSGHPGGRPWAPSARRRTAGWQVEGTLRQAQAEAPYLLDVPVVVQTAGAPATATRERWRTGGGLRRRGRRAAPRPPRRSRVRRLPQARPARDARRRSARSSASRASWRCCPRRPRRRDRRLPRPGRGLAQRQPSARDRHRRRDRRSCPADRAVWLLGRDNRFAARLFAVGRRTTPSTTSRARGRRGDHPPRRITPSWSSAATRRTWRRPSAGSSPTAAARCRVSAASCPTTASTPTSASRARSRPTSSRASGRRPTRRCASTCDRRPSAATAVRGPGPAAAEGAGRAAAGLLPEGPDGARGLARRPRARGAGPRHRGSRRGRRVHRRAVREDRPRARRRRRDLLPVLHDHEDPGRRARHPPQRHRRPARARSPSGRTSRRSSPPTTTTWAAAGPTSTPATRARSTPAPTTTPAAWPCCSSWPGPSPPPGSPGGRIVFVAFTGEEAGMLGSRHYVEHPVPPPRPGHGRHQPRHRGPPRGQEALGARHRHRLRVAAHLPRGELRHRRREPDDPRRPRVLRPEELHRPRASRRCRSSPAPTPTTTGPATPWTRSTAAGLVKVATFVKEGIVYLAEREEPLTNTIASRAASRRRAAPRRPAASRPGSGRRVSFGTVPDFAFSGPGVKVAGVVPGSPAEKAGVKEGDVLLRFAGTGRREPAGLLRDPQGARAGADGDGRRGPRRRRADARSDARREVTRLRRGSAPAGRLIRSADARRPPWGPKPPLPPARRGALGGPHPASPPGDRPGRLALPGSSASPWSAST